MIILKGFLRVNDRGIKFNLIKFLLIKQYDTVLIYVKNIDDSLVENNFLFGTDVKTGSFSLFVSTFISPLEVEFFTIFLLLKMGKGNKTRYIMTLYGIKITIRQ